MEAQERKRLREHKRRMIANQRQKKQEGLNDILHKVKEEITESMPGDSFSSLYSPIPSLEGPPIWPSIPPSCTPDQAVLDTRDQFHKQPHSGMQLGMQLRTHSHTFYGVGQINPECNCECVCKCIWECSSECICERSCVPAKKLGEYAFAAAFPTAFPNAAVYGIAP